MKSIGLIMILLLVPAVLFSQVSYAEYFVDTDPGYGKATKISISIPAQELTLDFNVNSVPMTEGWHYIGLRARNNSGGWGIVNTRIIYLTKFPTTVQAGIVKAEYFIDTDPGYGKAKQIAVALPGTNLSFDVTSDISALGPGFHYLAIRASDATGKWSTSFNRMFLLVRPADSEKGKISRIEYFYDTDPGIGKGTQVNVQTPGFDITLNVIASVTSLTSGDHVIYLRAMNKEGQWGQLYAEGFNLTISGVDDVKVTTAFKIYPNPGKNDFTMVLPENIGEAVRVIITDMKGAVLFEDIRPSDSASLSVDLNPGMYIVTIKSDMGGFSQILSVSK